MSDPKVAVVAGDGIGPEVIEQGLKVIEASGVKLDITEFDLGGHRYLLDQTILPDEVLAQWRSFDAIYLGAVGHPDCPPGLIERGLLLKMRFELDLFINQRPFVTDQMDLMVVRENTEGPYVGEGGVLRRGTPHEVATQGSVNTRMGVERCVRHAFELAKVRKQKLTLVHKTNVLTFAGDLWQRVTNEVAASYPEVVVGYHHVDAACIHLIENPGQYDVIVTDNLFGDILTDLAGAVSGGIGHAASANLNTGDGPSMFEPVHGSAPDIAGQNKANPIAAIKSAAMMLEYLGFASQAQNITSACEMADDSSNDTLKIADSVLLNLSS